MELVPPVVLGCRYRCELGRQLDLLCASLLSASLPFSASRILWAVDWIFIKSPLGVCLMKSSEKSARNGKPSLRAATSWSDSAEALALG